MARPSGIPRLQEVAFLADAMLAAADRQTFDQIRLDLFDAMERRRASQTLTGNHAGVRRRGIEDEEFGYLRNATEALAELMRLGYLERQPLPSSRETLELHRRRTFQLTEPGRRWVAALAERRFADAYDELLAGLWRQHPQLAAFVGKLAQAPFIVPTAQWVEAQSDAPTASIAERRENYVRFLADRCGRAMVVERLGWSATVEEVAHGITSYVADRIRAAATRGRTDPYPRGQDYVNACEEALVKFAFSQARIKMDYLSSEILRRWCRDLGVASFSYHVPTRPALVMWATAEVREGRDGIRVRRRNTRDDENAVIDALPESFRQARVHERSDFVAIYLVRAWACQKLRVSEQTFDRALARSIEDPAALATARVHLDPAQYRPVPPTERPFTRKGQHFYSMTLVPTKQRTPV